MNTAPLGLALALALAATAPAGAQTTGFAPGEVPAAPFDGGPRAFEVVGVAGQLNLRAAMSTGAEIAGRAGLGAFLANMGCAEAEGRTWCQVQPIEGGPVGYAAAEFLRGAVGPDGAVAIGPDMSALRAGQGDFDATGPIPCAKGAGAPMGACEMGVARAGSGWATVVVTRADGGRRTLYFSLGRAIGADLSQADGDTSFSASREGDLTRIQAGDERYEVADAVVLGG